MVSSSHTPHPLNDKILQPLLSKTLVIVVLLVPDREPLGTAHCHPGNPSESGGVQAHMLLSEVLNPHDTPRHNPFL